MGNIIFPPSSSPGPNPQESSGRLINAMAEKLGDGARNPLLLTRVPGLLPFATVPLNHTRGFIAVSSTLILVAVNEAMYSMTSAGVPSNLGALSGSGLVTMAKNNVSPTPDIVTVSEYGAFLTPSGGGVSAYPDPDLPVVNSVASLGGYFLFTTLAGQIWASELNSGAVEALSFTNAAARSDNLLRGVAFRNEYFAFGESSIEVYSNAGLTPFPLQFVTMIPRGLAGKFAVAGHEEGWSNELIWAGDDSVVYKLNGYSPQRISTHDVERSIEGTSDKSLLRACVYMRSGHAHWALTGPDWTWVYDLTTGQWHERASHLTNRWRASCTVKAFDKWIAGDETTGKLFQITDGYQYEDVNPLTFTARSAPTAAFPSRQAVPRADFDFTVGVGSEFGVTPIQTDPTVSIRWSDDAGSTWSTPLIRALGAQGAYRTRVSVFRTGMAGPGGRVWEVSCSDPVHVGLLGGSMAVEERAA